MVISPCRVAIVSIAVAFIVTNDEDAQSHRDLGQDYCMFFTPCLSPICQAGRHLHYFIVIMIIVTTLNPKPLNPKPWAWRLALHQAHIAVVESDPAASGQSRHNHTIGTLVITYSIFQGFLIITTV